MVEKNTNRSSKAVAPDRFLGCPMMSNTAWPTLPIIEPMKRGKGDSGARIEQ